MFSCLGYVLGTLFIAFIVFFLWFIYCLFNGGPDITDEDIFEDLYNEGIDEQVSERDKN